MEAGRITDENFELFESFLTPFVLFCRKNQEPLALLGLTDHALAIGAAALSFFHETPELISLYVASDYRSKGGGSLLVQTAEMIAKELSLPLTVSFLLEGAAGKKLSEFFIHRGYSRVEDAVPFYRIPLSSLLFMNAKAPMQLSVKSVRAFSEVPGQELRNLSADALKAGLPAPPEGFMAPTVHRELSFLSTDAIGALDGYLILEKTGEKELTISGMYQREPISRVGIAMLQAALKRSEKLCSMGTMIVAAAVHPVAKHLILYFMPKAVNESYVFEKAV